MEIWKDVPGYEGNYRASTLGNVMSLERKVKKSKVTDRILKPVYDTYGYGSVRLCLEGDIKRFRVHRVIAMTFIENPDNKPCVNHINGIKTDNRVENLEWVTVKENNDHAYATGLKKRSYPNQFGRNKTK